MSNKNRKLRKKEEKQLLENVKKIAEIILTLVSAVCMIYTTFFK